MPELNNFMGLKAISLGDCDGSDSMQVVEVVKTYAELFVAKFNSVNRNIPGSHKLG
ncbi:hypothetical protein GCM10011339_07170 [Echinicola rosea]|uniref:Uncharacterized protein n=1 Tax=Echinicola rosea TaxID=1807691 RepID=A0ABQ1UMI6_9BACT|nr:hypothetical protein GCM10011339_07170 [Echinicola rosea]